MIISQPRTASHYLVDCLKYNRKVYREPFNIKNMPKYNEDYEKTITNDAILNKNLLLKTHFNQLFRLKYTDYLCELFDYKIALLRKDIVESTISQILADKTKQFHKFNYNLVESFVIHEEIFLKYLNERFKDLNNFVEWKKKNLFNEIVYYEDLVFNYKKDFKNLKLSSIIKIKKPIKEFHKSPDKKIILLNYEELREYGFSIVKKWSHEGIINKEGFLELK